MSRLALALVAALGAAAVLAQEERPGGTDRPARTEAFKLVDAYVVSNLQESLGLTDEQFAKAIPLVKKLQAERREYYLERARRVRDMRRLLQQGGATEAQVLDLLRQVKALDAQGPDETRRNLAALDAMLSPIQQAKFRVLEADVEQRMRELMSRARQRGPRPGAGAPRE